MLSSQWNTKKAPSPDGFPIEFHQKRWDLEAMLDGFNKRDLDISRLNHGIITIVPKTKDARQIRKFRPICLLNESFKFFTEI